jgi:fructose-bisphosphate aldolase, class II
MMKLTVWLLTVAQCAAFAPAVRAPSTAGTAAAASASALFSTKQVETKRREGGVAGELGLPCEGECEISRYPNLPDSVHPGVLSGKALIDLLQDAKSKGAHIVPPNAL